MPSSGKIVQPSPSNKNGGQKRGRQEALAIAASLGGAAGGGGGRSNGAASPPFRKKHKSRNINALHQLLFKEERLLASLITPKARNLEGKFVRVCWDYISIHGCPDIRCRDAHPSYPIPYEDLCIPLNMAILALGGSMSMKGPLKPETRDRLIAEQREIYRKNKKAVLESIVATQEQFGRFGSTYVSLSHEVKRLLIQHQVVMKSMPPDVLRAIALRKQQQGGQQGKDSSSLAAVTLVGEPGHYGPAAAGHYGPAPPAPAAGLSFAGDGTEVEDLGKVYEDDEEKEGYIREEEVDYSDMTGEYEMKILVKNDEAVPKDLEEGEIEEEEEGGGGGGGGQQNIRFPSVGQAAAYSTRGLWEEETPMLNYPSVAQSYPTGSSSNVQIHPEVTATIVQPPLRLPSPGLLRSEDALLEEKRSSSRGPRAEDVAVPPPKDKDVAVPLPHCNDEDDDHKPSTEVMEILASAHDDQKQEAVVVTDRRTTPNRPERKKDTEEASTPRRRNDSGTKREPPCSGGRDNDQTRRAETRQREEEKDRVNYGSMVDDSSEEERRDLRGRRRISRSRSRGRSSRDDSSRDRRGIDRLDRRPRGRSIERQRRRSRERARDDVSKVTTSRIGDSSRNRSPGRRSSGISQEEGHRRRSPSREKNKKEDDATVVSSSTSSSRQRSRSREKEQHQSSPSSHTSSSRQEKEEKAPISSPPIASPSTTIKDPRKRVKQDNNNNIVDTEIAQPPSITTYEMAVQFLSYKGLAPPAGNDVVCFNAKPDDTCAFGSSCHNFHVPFKELKLLGMGSNIIRFVSFRMNPTPAWASLPQQLQAKRDDYVKLRTYLNIPPINSSSSTAAATASKDVVVPVPQASQDGLVGGKASSSSSSGSAERRGKAVDNHAASGKAKPALSAPSASSAAATLASAVEGEGMMMITKDEHVRQINGLQEMMKDAFDRLTQEKDMAVREKEAALKQVAELEDLVQANEEQFNEDMKLHNDQRNKMVGEARELRRKLAEEQEKIRRQGLRITELEDKLQKAALSSAYGGGGRGGGAAAAPAAASGSNSGGGSSSSDASNPVVPAMYTNAFSPTESSREEVEDFDRKYILLWAYCENKRPKKPNEKRNVIQKIERDNAVEPLLARMRTIKDDRFFWRFRVQAFQAEAVLDDGGATREAYTLFFEQLKDYKKVLILGGNAEKEMEFPLFEATGGGKIFLPTRPTSPEIEEAMMASKEIEDAYRMIGKLFHKMIIDFFPMPSAWASDLLISFLLHEEGKLPLGLLQAIMHDIEPDYAWSHRILIPPHLDLTVGQLLGEDGDGDGGGGAPAVKDDKVTQENCERVFRAFFDKRILSQRVWQLERIREGFSQQICGATLLHFFLSTFNPGAQRQRLICGEENFSPDVLLPLIEYPVEYQEKNDTARLRQVFYFHSALASFTPTQCKHFFRATTGLGSIPEAGVKIKVILKDTDQHLTFATCTYQVYVPMAKDVEEMRSRILESIDPRNLAFGELGGY